MSPVGYFFNTLWRLDDAEPICAALCSLYNPYHHAREVSFLDALPPRIQVNEPGSFAEFTMRQRLPAILQDTLRANAYPTEVVSDLLELESEISGALVRPFEDAGSDCAFWSRSWQQWRGHTWKGLPWFWAETYFYRRLLAAVRYFQPGEWFHVDPFASIKQDALQSGLKRLSALLELDNKLKAPEERLRFWLINSLWSNRSDFSNKAALAYARQPAPDVEILVDDSEAVTWGLVEQDLTRLDIVCDNAGPELLTDLALADMLLYRRYAAQVVLHLKAQPYYVSDAMPEDALSSIAALVAHPELALASLGARLQNWVECQSLCLQAHPFWVSCLALCEVPADLELELSHANLLLFKGDVNYRRLLDDRHWPFDTSLVSIPNRLPQNYLALRAIKSELVCGLEASQVARLQLLDPQWMVNGRWGLIQYVAHSLLDKS
ncbi:MAG: protein-glutamate O-methyltransferase family protein [Chloroflexi bacterium]|nr:protein-glutamate O-methyltransferase family protein [Chloroflexota bacterium]